jgi:hypothetical protein
VLCDSWDREQGVTLSNAINNLGKGCLAGLAYLEDSLAVQGTGVSLLVARTAAETLGSQVSSRAGKQSTCRLPTPGRSSLARSDPLCV